METDKLIESLRNCVHGGKCSDCQRGNQFTQRKHGYCHDVLMLDAADALANYALRCDSDSKIIRSLQQSCDKLAAEHRELRAKETAVTPVIKHRHYGGYRVVRGIDKMGNEVECQVDERYEADVLHCPKCRAALCSRWQNYCPHCGAKMQEGD